MSCLTFFVCCTQITKFGKTNPRSSVQDTSFWSGLLWSFVKILDSFIGVYKATCFHKWSVFAEAQILPLNSLLASDHPTSNTPFLIQRFSLSLNTPPLWNLRFTTTRKYKHGGHVFICRTKVCYFLHKRVFPWHFLYMYIATKCSKWEWGSTKKCEWTNYASGENVYKYHFPTVATNFPIQNPNPKCLFWLTVGGFERPGITS